MRQILLLVVTAIIASSLVCGDRNVKNIADTIDEKSEKVDEKMNSVKIKRGIHAYPNGLTYTLPSSFHTYNPYAKFPGIYKSGIHPIAPHYALTPGNAVTHSFSANYPRFYLPPKPVLRAPIPTQFLVPKPIVPVPPVYANRYPVFVPKPAIIPRPIIPLAHVPQFTVPSVVSTPHVHTTVSAPVPIPLPVAVPASIPTPASIPFPSAIPPQTFISQNGWRPTFSSGPSVVQSSHPNTPSLTILPPFGPSNNLVASNHIQRPSNYYLPTEPLQDVATRSAQIGLNHANLGRLIMI